MLPCWIPRSLSAKLLSQVGWVVVVYGAVPLQVQDLAHLLVKLTPGRQQSRLVTRFPSYPLSKIFMYIDCGDKL